MSNTIFILVTCLLPIFPPAALLLALHFFDAPRGLRLFPSFATPILDLFHSSIFFPSSTVHVIDEFVPLLLKE